MNLVLTVTPVFDLGLLVATPAIADKCAQDIVFNSAISAALNRHATGDWGELCDEDKESNDKAISPTEPQRVLSSYMVRDENSRPAKIWIVTEWDRSVTTILYPDEY